MQSHGHRHAPRVEEAARLLAEHRVHKCAFDRFPEAIAPTDEPHAYEIQESLHRHLAAMLHGSADLSFADYVRPGVECELAVRFGEGHGRDILGDPLVALRWLANEMSRRERELRAGDLVSLGSLVATQWVANDDVVVVECPELGRVTARFG